MKNIFYWLYWKLYIKQGGKMRPAIVLFIGLQFVIINVQIVLLSMRLKEVETKTSNVLTILKGE